MSFGQVRAVGVNGLNGPWLGLRGAPLGTLTPAQTYGAAAGAASAGIGGALLYAGVKLYKKKHPIAGIIVSLFGVNSLLAGGIVALASISSPSAAQVATGTLTLE